VRTSVGPRSCTYLRSGGIPIAWHTSSWWTRVIEPSAATTRSAGRPFCQVQQRCYTRFVPTTHRRLALTRDPELDAALHRGAELLGNGRPDSAIARDLILRGAEALAASSGSELDRWLTARGAEQATRSTADVLALADKRGASDRGKPRALSEAVSELREERL
jgi:hypothetical protein